MSARRVDGESVELDAGRSGNTADIAEDKLAAFEAGISIEEYRRRNRPH